ncbi:MAG: NAD(P)/FAD-dependent oxidoreductase [Bacteroidales bacterium]|nr:NAD(P)/FAD-dependent oxidoreductase [Bacteroidales bacterium]
MPRQIQITVAPHEAALPEVLQQKIAAATATAATALRYRIIRRSVDARKRGHVKILLSIETYAPGEPLPLQAAEFRFRNVADAPPVVIVGAGPAGLFAALRLIELGKKPIIIERGKETDRRKRDIALLCRGEGLHPDSNYCFGEGGAGAFSDGKLYTRANKRGDALRILQLLHHHGADDSILIDARPHIGSDRLPAIIQEIRQTIVRCGGEYRFEQKMNGLILANGQVQGITTETGEKFCGTATILATGHSASDVFELFFREGYLLEAKPFAAGVRIEHPQALINDLLYRRDPHRAFLPPAAYALTTQVRQRGVYSFCMCPGGIIVPSATSPDGQVVNGMSASARRSAFANAGIVVEIRPEDTAPFHRCGALAGLRFRQEMERLAAIAGGGLQHAPAQRTTDFVAAKPSTCLPACSYLPGVAASPLHQWLPNHLAQRLQDAFRLFDKKMKGFLTAESLIAGVESRSSSPVRIPRDSRTMQHPQLKGLYPCGEGSGHAGGITSSAMDGIRAAEAIADTP